MVADCAGDGDACENTKSGEERVELGIVGVGDDRPPDEGEEPITGDRSCAASSIERCCDSFLRA